LTHTVQFNKAAS